jgi:hypothetical protein
MRYNSLSTLFVLVFLFVITLITTTTTAQSSRHSIKINTHTPSQTYSRSHSRPTATSSSIPTTNSPIPPPTPSSIHPSASYFPSTQPKTILPPAISNLESIGISLKELLNIEKKHQNQSLESTITDQLDITVIEQINQLSLEIRCIVCKEALITTLRYLWFVENTTTNITITNPPITTGTNYTVLTISSTANTIWPSEIIPNRDTISFLCNLCLDNESLSNTNSEN